MVISMLPITVFANKEKDDRDEPETPTIPITSSNPGYILQLVAGEDGYAGSGGSFTVTYTDSKGKTGQKLTVDFYEGYKTLFPDQAFSRSTDVYKNITDNYMFGTKSLSAYEANSIARYYTGSYYSGDTFALTPYSSCTFSLGGLPEDLKEITAVEVKLDSRDSLSMQSLRIIKLKSWSSGLNCLSSYMNGTLSSQMEGSWYGELVAEATGTCNGETTTTFSTSNSKLTWYASNRTVLDNQSSSQGFSMHFADTPTAGIESMMAGYNDDEIQAYFFGTNYSNEDFKKMGNSAYLAYSNLNPIFKECLTLELTYLDVMGDTRKIEIPVVTSYLINILVSNKGQLCGYNDTTWISGILQQNETIGLALQLAQYKSLVGLQLIYGQSPTGMTNRDNVRTVDTDKDTIAVDSMCFYGYAASFKMKYSTQHLSCLLEAPNATLSHHYTSSSPDGALLSTGYKLNITLDNGRLIEGAPSQKELKDTYVFTLTNSGVENAGTYSGIYMDITYMDTNGFEHTLEDLSLKELVGEFYGYTCNHDVLLFKQSNNASGYYIGDKAMDRYMQYWELLRHPGTVTMFRISATNVAYFKSISFSIQNEGTQQELFLSGSNTQIDSWQLNSINVQKATAIGQRYSDGRTHRPESYTGTAFPCWKRDVTGEDVAWSNQKMLLQSGVLSQTIFLNYVDSNGAIVKPEQSIKENTDYLDRLPTSMTYHDALKDLGLAIPKHTYQITVCVAEVPDAGSTNYFYFQLIFENGTSAVVLANQQLSSDSFRQGQEETFQIQTTQNYGTLKSVRIICDSASSTSNVFDKLNISKIEVMQVGTTGVNRVWNINNIGWIDINYADEGSLYYSGNSDVIVPVETTNVQLVREYAVTGITTAVDLQFCISTAPGSKLSVNTLTSSSQLDSKFWATLVYLDSTGARKERGFDLTKQLQSFNGTDELTWMYRPNHVDRFILSVPDISSVISLEISRSDDGADWIVGGISVQQIGGAGSVYMSYNAEYIRDLTSAVDLAESDQDGTIVISGKDSYLFRFTENTITINQTDDDSWDATISREPTTTNDTLNVYLYSGKLMEKDYPFTGNTAIKASLKYSTRYGGSMQTSFTFQRGTSDGQSVMYAEGISVSDMATLNSMTLNDQSSHSYSTVVAHAVIERVRGDVIIDTYRMDFGNFLEHSGPSKPTSTVVNPMRQRVTLLSAAGQDNVSLTAETHDVAVALRYTSASALDGPKKVYQSPYIYLTDQQITMLSSNQNVELNFEVCNIDQIVGLSVISTGPVFRYDGATVQNFNAQNNNLLSSCNADSGFAASAVETIVQLSEGNTSTAVFTFVTPPNTEVAGAGTFGQVSMMVTYTNSAGETMTRNFDDLISRLPTGASFSSGTTAELTLLLPDAQSIETVTLYAPDDDWYLSAVGVILTRSDETVEQKAVQTNSWVKMLEPLEVDLNAADNTVLGLTITATSQMLGMTTSSNGGSYMLVNARPGDTISLTPSVSYSGTPDTSCIWNLGDWKNYCTPRLDNGQIFSVPQDAQNGDSYLITVSATSAPSISVTVMIRVTTKNILDSTLKVTCKTESTGQIVEGTSANDVFLYAYTNDIIAIKPTYNGNSLLASEWTWDLNNAVGTTDINGAGELEWSLQGKSSVGDSMVIRLTHNETAAQVVIEVTVVGSNKVEDVYVVAESTGTKLNVDSKTDRTIYINAYADDILYITPYVGDETLSKDDWAWQLVTTDYLFETDDTGRATVDINNWARIGDVQLLNVTHLESATTINIVITIVARETQASSITVNATVSSSGAEVTGAAGTTIKLEARVTDTITLMPYFDGQPADGRVWEWDLTEVRYNAAQGSEGYFKLTFRDDVEVGTVLTTTLTHIPSDLQVTVEVTIVPFDAENNTLTLSATAIGTDEYQEIGPGQTIYLNAWADDNIYIYPMINGETTKKADWTYTCSKDDRIYKDYVLSDGTLWKYKLEDHALQVGDNIIFTVTHVETDAVFTVMVTIVDYE